jgi:hypothetical protein
MSLEPEFISGFVDEMESLYKTARIKHEEGKPSLGELVGHIGKKIGKYMIGAGIGSGAGYVFAKKILPKFENSLTPKKRLALSVASGALAGILGSKLTHKVLSTKDWQRGTSKRKR